MTAEELLALAGDRAQYNSRVPAWLDGYRAALAELLDNHTFAFTDENDEACGQAVDCDDINALDAIAEAAEKAGGW